MRTLIGVIAFLLPASTAESVELTILTPTGHITFSAPDEWSVISSQTKMPVAVMAFQIVDPFDEATSDSTNVAVNFYDDNTSEGREAIKNVGKRYGTVKPKTSRVGEWHVFDQRAIQNGTSYTILDARRRVADVTVSVRLAWPHLPAHPKSHDREMREVFKRLLASFRGELGPYQPKPGEVARRPNP